MMIAKSLLMCSGGGGGNAGLVTLTAEKVPSGKYTFFGYEKSNTVGEDTGSISPSSVLLNNGLSYSIEIMQDALMGDTISEFNIVLYNPSGQYGTEWLKVTNIANGKYVITDTYSVFDDGKGSYTNYAGKGLSSIGVVENVPVELLLEFTGPEGYVEASLTIGRAEDGKSVLYGYQKDSFSSGIPEFGSLVPDEMYTQLYVDSTLERVSTTRAFFYAGRQYSDGSYALDLLTAFAQNVGKTVTVWLRPVHSGGTGDE